jgi:hypothetical protein
VSAEPDVGPDRAAWHGPASPWAAAVGLLVTGTPYVLGLQGTAWLLLALAPPAAGLVLLAAGDRVRHVATGLLAAGLVVPLLLVGALLAAAVGSALLG